MTGRRPDTTKAWNFIDHFREPGVGANWISLPEYFKLHNYTTLGGGKTFHPGLPPFYDEPRSWSQQMGYYLFFPEVCPGEETFCGSNESMTHFYDYRLAQHSIEALQLAKNLDAPFFIAVGFRRPHKPWRVPQEFFSMYPNWTDIKPAKFLNHTIGIPPIAFNEANFNISGAECKSDINNPLPLNVQQQVRLAYYASVTWVDSMVGLVLSELDRLDLRNDTVVVVFGDHGWQLGENDEWSKFTNFELATRVPLIFRVTWKPVSIGKTTNAFAELVDLYPTLVDLAGLPQPSTENLEGKSLASYFDNPDGGSVVNYTLSQFPRCPHNLSVQWKGNGCMSTKREDFFSMGYSIRTETFRYTEWLRWNGTSLRVDWSDVIGVELYDYQGDDGYDFDAFERVNLAGDSIYASIVQELHVALVRAVTKSW